MRRFAPTVPGRPAAAEPPAASARGGARFKLRASFAAWLALPRLGVAQTPRRRSSRRCVWLSAQDGAGAMAGVTQDGRRAPDRRPPRRKAKEPRSVTCCGRPMPAPLATVRLQRSLLSAFWSGTPPTSAHLNFHGYRPNICCAARHPHNRSPSAPNEQTCCSYYRPWKPSSAVAENQDRTALCAARTWLAFTQQAMCNWNRHSLQYRSKQRYDPAPSSGSDRSGENLPSGWAWK